MLALLSAGVQLGNYELVRAIGSGGMGVVYEARHRALRRRVAIKVLHPLALDQPGGQVVTERFLREGRAAAQVQHEHIVDVFDFGVQDGMPFLVMELVEGENLAQRLERKGRLEVSEAVALLLPVVSAVADLHAAGILHRDLKPANILLAPLRSGGICPKVADFGVSRFDDGSVAITGSGVVLGTCAYMSPEQARASKVVTEQTDQYAIGAIFYQCLTGRLPFEGATPYDVTHAVLHAELVPPTVHAPALPPALDAVLLRALARDPRDRYPSADDFGAALLPFAETEVAERWTREFELPRSARPSSPSSGFASERAEPPPALPPRAMAWRLPVAVTLGAVLAGAAALRVAAAPPKPSARSSAATAPQAPSALAVALTSADTRAPPAPPRASIAPPAPAPASPPKSPVKHAPPPTTSGHAPGGRENAAAPSREPRPAAPASLDDNGAPILDPG